jgi:hypothetical protein
MVFSTPRYPQTFSGVSQIAVFCAPIISFDPGKIFLHSKQANFIVAALLLSAIFKASAPSNVTLALNFSEKLYSYPK